MQITLVLRGPNRLQHLPKTTHDLWPETAGESSVGFKAV